MELYLVHSDEFEKEMVEEKCNLMLSYATIPPSKSGEVEIPKGFPSVLIDSGGYQLQTGAKGARDISLTGYCSWLQYALPKFPEIHGYMGMDILGDVKQTLKNLEYMEAEGLKPLPVWHPKDGDEVLEYYTKKYEYIALGAIAKGKKMEIRHIFERVKTRYPDHKFHLLGVGINASVALVNMRPYSVDFSTWMTPFRYGNDLIWSKKDGLLHEHHMNEAWRNKIKSSKEFRTSVVKSILNKLKTYSTILDNYNSNGLQQQFDFRI